MLPFGVTIPATIPQGSEIPEGLMNNPVLLRTCLTTRSIVRGSGYLSLYSNSLRALRSRDWIPVGTRFFDGRSVCMNMEQCWHNDRGNPAAIGEISCLFLGPFGKNCEQRLLASSCLSVLPHRNTRLPFDGLSWHLIFDYFFFEKLLRKFKLH